MSSVKQGPETQRRHVAAAGVVLVAVSWLLRVLTAAGLAIDAYVHADLASYYDPVRKSVSQGELFRIEAGLASLAALLILAYARRLTWVLAVLTAGGGLAALLVYRYVNVGALGPLPNMYEPVWFPEKTATTIAQAVATVTALGGLALAMYLRRKPRQRANSRPELGAGVRDEDLLAGNRVEHGADPGDVRAERD